jgi:hypothetical protein
MRGKILRNIAMKMKSDYAPSKIVSCALGGARMRGAILPGMLAGTMAEG